MSGPNFNITTQQAATKNPSIIDVYDTAQMPLTLAPDGVMRFKAALSTKYILHSGVVLPRLEIPKFSNPLISETIEFTSAVNGQFIPVAGDSTPHVWGRNTNIVLFRNIVLVDATPQTTKLFDLVGGAPLASLILNNAPLLNFQDIGNVVDLNISAPNITFVNFEKGLVSRNNTLAFILSLTNGRLANLSAVTTQTPALCFQGSQSSVATSVNALNLIAGDAVFCIDSAAIGTFDIIGNSYNGVSNFFEPDISNSITAFANVDVAITSFSDSAVDPGVDTSCNFAAATDLVIGQTILIADEAAYDGTHTVVRVADDQLSVDINVVFSTSGAGTLKRTKVTSAGSRLNRDQTNTISGTTSYNGTTNILEIIDNNNFVIPVAFVANDATGTVAATSGNEKTLGITAALNGQAPDSTTSAEVELINNTLETIVPAVDALVLIASTPVFIGKNLQRITTTTDGASTYVGLKEVTLKMDGNITMEPANATKSLQATFFRQDAIRNTVTFTNATNLINETATAVADGDTITFNDNVGTLPSEVRNDIVYFVVNKLTDSFQISYTSGGAAITFTDDGSGTNTYATGELHGSTSTLSISAADPGTLVPQALADVSTNDTIFPVISNKSDTVNILVSKSYYRVFI